MIDMIEDGALKHYDEDSCLQGSSLLECATLAYITIYRDISVCCEGNEALVLLVFLSQSYNRSTRSQG